MICKIKYAVVPLAKYNLVSFSHLLYHSYALVGNKRDEKRYVMTVSRRKCHCCVYVEMLHTDHTDVADGIRLRYLGMRNTEGCVRGMAKISLMVEDNKRWG